jgi:hypothetical protein
VVHHEEEAVRSGLLGDGWLGFLAECRLFNLSDS